MVPVRPLGRSPLVQWGPAADIVTKAENPTYAETQIAVGGGDTIEYREGNGVDDTMWNSGVGTYNTNAVPALWGITQLYSLSNSLNDAYNYQMRNASPYDYIRMRARDGLDYSVERYSILIWSETGGGVDLTGQSASYDVALQANFTQGGQVHAAIRNGASDWYVSESSRNTTGVMEIPDVAAEKWTLLTVADTNSTEMMTVTNNVFSDAPAFDDIQAVGFFADNGMNCHIESFRLVVGQQPTVMQIWTDDQGIYNADAAADADPDLDGVVNILEWGLFGDPQDPESTGSKPKLAGVDAAGTSLIYLYPRKVNEPKPAYTVVESGDLFLGFSDNSGTYVETGSGPNVGGSFGEYVWVTNTIPMDLNEKFIDLDVQEP
jgi:hypothetical protein